MFSKALSPFEGSNVVLGDVGLGDVRLGDVGLGDVRLGDVGLGLVVANGFQRP